MSSVAPVPDSSPMVSRAAAFVKSLGAEAQGIERILPEQRTSAGYFANFALFISANVQLNTFASGMLGNVLFGMGLRDACLTIVFFNLIGASVPGLFAAFGARTGLRFAYGYYGAMFIGFLNLANLIGFCTVTAIVGGQALAATSTGLSWNVGIVLIALISMVIAFMGYKQLLGAAVQAAVATNPKWQAGYLEEGTPGVLKAVLAPGGRCQLYPHQYSQMPPQIKTLFLGATGFIGGSVLDAILQHPVLAAKLDISALHRSAADKARLEALGVTAVTGDLSKDYDKIVALAAQSDLVIDIAHSDTSVAAILQGLEQRWVQKKAIGEDERPVYIHTSGTGVLSDDSMGMFEGHDVYEDSILDDMKRIPDTAWHRDVDLSIYKADEEGYVSAYLVLPAVVYGTGTGPVKTESEQIPKLVDLALARGKAGQVGEGLSVLYIRLLERIVVDTARVTSGWEGTFIGTTGSHTWGSLSVAIGKRLHELGHLTSPEVNSFTDEELQKIGSNAGKLLGSNSRSVATRARRDLGWEPKEKSILESIEEDIDYHLKLKGLN
ncbi:hypothetical protein MNV49_000762 [Pseudohyphozyma bogoriensis]|nr:hypothetical protein MNV49_000762 [Pseudohyphozyma bogoriensis]